jgi:flagellar hook protein FlgE
MISKTFSNKAKAGILAASVVVAGGVGTMALLTDTSQTTIQITSASLGMSVNGEADGSYIVDMDSTNLSPGETRTGQITVKNDSTIPIVVDASKGSLTGFTSTLKDGPADVTQLNLAKGESKVLTLSIALPDTITAPPATQPLTVKFDASQVPS